MRLAIVGSRDFFDAAGQVMCYLAQYRDGADITIVSGGARGVDQAAEREARRRGFDVCVYPADWRRDGKAAGYIRDEDIVLDSDKVVAFWDGQSKGTKHTIDLALKHKKHLEVIFP